MLFKDLKVGYPIYILHKSGEKRVSQGKVTAISPSHLPQAPSLQAMQMVVDVTIEDEGTTRTYTTTDTISVTYASDLVLSTDKEGIIREVEILKNQCVEELAKHDDYTKSVEAYDKILTDWNPVFREKKETEERFSKMENRIDGLTDMLKQLVEKLN